MTIPHSPERERELENRVRDSALVRTTPVCAVKFPCFADAGGKRFMKLDRNINSDGSGKYALIDLRKLRELQKGGDAEKFREAIDLLCGFGLITWGNESKGEQFFVMKYKDKFTAPALKAYADAVYIESQSEALKMPTDFNLINKLHEYAAELRDEAKKAQRVGKQIPD